MNSISISQFVIWIDDFYSQPELREFPFPEALKYAYKRSQIKEEDELFEKFKNNLLEN